MATSTDAKLLALREREVVALEQQAAALGHIATVLGRAGIRGLLQEHDAQPLKRRHYGDQSATQPEPANGQSKA